MKRSIFLLPLILGMIFLLPLISSANTVTVDIPASNSYISGTQVITANLDTNTLNLTNAWFHLMFSNGTNVTINAYNFNVTSTQFNYSLDTTGYVDDDGITFWVTVANETPTSASNTTAYTTATINIDNGLPTATSSSASQNYGYKAKYTDTLTYGLNADNSIGISSCRVIFTNRENNTVVDTGTTMTGYACANTTLTPQAVGLPKGTTWDVVVQATDGNTNRTNSSKRILSILQNTANAPGTVGGGGGISFGEAVSNFASSVWSTFQDFVDWITFWN